MRRGAEGGRRGRRTAEVRLATRPARLARAVAGPALAAVLALPATAVAQQDAPERLDRGRLTAVFFPDDRQLARSLLADAVSRDTFPGLPRPRQRVLLAIAPDERRFREWIGPAAPEWGAAVAFPDLRRIIMQGSGAGSDAGDPLVTFRHELAHLALVESMGDLPPRWFDEGYASFAAGEYRRDELLATNVALVFRGIPPLDSLDAWFAEGSGRAQAGYALAHRAVAELASLDRERGLALFFEYWRERGSMDAAVRAAYGMTLDAFETRWRSSTKRRFGGLALFADLALVGVVVLALLLPLYISRRRRDRRRMAALRAADTAAELAARESMLAALLSGAGDATGGRTGTSPETGPEASEDERRGPPRTPESEVP